MTRKDYILIAAAIKSSRDDVHNQHRHIVDCVAARLARTLEADNPRFDFDRFIEACK